MLHDDDLRPFPYSDQLATALAESFAFDEGMELIGNVSHGFVSYHDEWIRYIGDYPKWFHFVRRPFWNGPTFRFEGLANLSSDSDDSDASH